MPDLWTIVLLGAMGMAVTELLLLERRRRQFLSRPRQPAAAQNSLAREPGRRSEGDLLRNARDAIARQAAALAAAARTTPGDTANGNGDPFATHAVHYVLHAMRAKPPPVQTARTIPSGAATPLHDAATPDPMDPTDSVAADGVPQAILHGTAPNAEWDAGSALDGATHSEPPEDTGGPAPSATMGEAIVYVDAAGRLTFANRVARELLHWETGGMALSDLLAGGFDESAALLESVARQELVRVPMTLLAGGAPVQAEINALALRDRNGSLWGAALFIRRTPA
jgi:hypothetical protein